MDLELPVCAGLPLSARQQLGARNTLHTRAETVVSPGALVAHADWSHRALVRMSHPIAWVRSRPQMPVSNEKSKAAKERERRKRQREEQAGPVLELNVDEPVCSAHASNRPTFAPLATPYAAHPGLQSIPLRSRARALIELQLQ